MRNSWVKAVGELLIIASKTDSLFAAAGRRAPSRVYKSLFCTKVLPGLYRSTSTPQKGFYDLLFGVLYPLSTPLITSNNKVLIKL